MPPDGGSTERGRQKPDNRKQRTDSWETFLKKQKIATQQAKPKKKTKTKKKSTKKITRKIRQPNTLLGMSNNLDRDLRKITGGF